MNLVHGGIPIDAVKKKLILPLSDNNEFFVGADFVVIELTHRAISRIKDLVKAVIYLQVYQISEYNYDSIFMLADYESNPDNGKVALKPCPKESECDTLQVTRTGFSWAGLYKHSSVRWETNFVPLSILDENGDFDGR